MPLLTAARLRSAPQVYIKGETPKPKRLLKDDANSGQQWLAVVLIKLGRRPVVTPVPAPADPYSYTTWLSRGKDPKKRDLTAITYKRIVKDVVLGKGNLRDGTISRPRRTIYLLHDRDPAHKSKLFAQFAANYNIHSELLPARSPDLDPLDYGVFGPAQKKLDRELELRSMTFEEQCNFLQEAIESADVDAAIMALPDRIARCIKAKGGHFE